ncbi:MAG: enoyl-[acyl-carrier-protein] reductase FabK [Tissierellia bacterium]|nr:enoyl-[acyl-carrier-protein] reductase FabK [Tissierellia bacterium]
MKLDKILGIEYPIIQGGMAHISDGKFAAKVSEAGALGVIGSGSMNGEELKKQIQICKSLTRKPFGVNLLLLNPHIDQMAEIVIEEKVPVITTGAGSPSKYIDSWHKANIKIFPVVPNPTLAMRMEKYGVDGVIVEGNEAGGHIGDMTSMTLIPQTKDRVSIPIIAAGGIASGRQMLAAKVLGATGVQIGTLFLSSTECPIHEEYKNLLIKSKYNNITIIGNTTGLPMRLIKNNMVRDYIKEEKQGKDKMELEKYTLGALKLAVELGDLKKGSFMAGLTLTQIEDIKPIKEIIEGLMKEYEEELEKIYYEIEDKE